MKKRYKIQSGRASWHQSRAGHFFASVMTADYTDAEIAALKTKLEASGEPFLIEESKRHDVRIHFNDGDTITTSINGTESEVRAYYARGREFERSDETMHNVTRLEFL